MSQRVHAFVMDPDGPPVLRVILPGGTGTVEIETRLTDATGAPVVRVDVHSNTDRYGPATDGREYVVKNGDPGPGTVFLVGRTPEQSTNECEGHYDTDDALTSGAGIGEPVYCDGSCNPATDDDMCDDGCGKHVDHKTNGDTECGPR